MLDCTLRDGGWVNQFSFGTELMKAVVSAAERAGVEYIELGYLDAQKGSVEGRSEYSDADTIRRNLLSEGKKTQITYLAMIDYGKYPVELLSEYSETGIDGIRLCFHKKDAAGAIQMGKAILDKGYRLLMQPMVCTRYTDREFEELILQVEKNLKTASAFYIVDSFGAMCQADVVRRLSMADRLLGEKISLGLHTHDNMRLSFSNAVAGLHAGTDRNLIIDGTLLGIGKGPGNLRIEEFAEYLNRNRKKNYDLTVLKDAAEKLIRPMQAEYVWGYCTEYYLSAKYGLTSSYAKMFCQEYHLTTKETEELLAMIPDEKKDSFDRRTAERILERYRETKRGRQGI